MSIMSQLVDMVDRGPLTEASRPCRSLTSDDESALMDLMSQPGAVGPVDEEEAPLA
jgi:hypothetical protein